MTKQTLHGIPKFIELQTDERFMGLLEYLKTHRPKATSSEPHGMIQDSGRMEQFFDVLERIEEAFSPLRGTIDIPRTAPYTHIPLSKENSK